MALAGAALMLAALTPISALACGMPLSARIPSEQALITFTNGREEIITSVHLQIDRPGAAVIFPVPGTPEVSVLENAELFSYLDQVTRPQQRIEEQLVWRDIEGLAGGGAPPGAVNVLGHEILGGYDVARLKADDPGALQAWLDENGYTPPPGAEPILHVYIDAGWKFVAVKLAPNQQANGALTPLRMAFDSREIVYPMRLGALAEQPLDVLLYILADHRVDIPGMTTQFAGPVAKLDQPPGRFGPIFRAPFLTKLRNFQITPASLGADFVARPAASDEAFRQVEVRTVYINGWNRLALPIGGIVLVVLASSIGLGIALGLRRRMNQIAGPGPRKEE
jgi:hypothetical protein